MKVKLKNVISDFLVPMRDKPKIFDGDIPWCRIEDIKGKYLSDTLSNQYVSKKIVKSMNLKVYPINTLLFTCSATIGVTAITKKSLCTNQTFIGLVASKEIEIEFLYYYLGLIGKDLIKAASVTTIPYLSKSFFENLEIELPSLRNQKQIAKVLSDLDAKIEVNNKINQELEAMAKTLYDYWFVQFDFPNEKDKPYKSSGGKMVFNKVLKRDIPEGWDIEKVSSSCQIVDCLHSKKSDYVFEHEDYYLLQLENIKQDNQLDISKKFYVSKAEYRRWTTRIEVQDGDLVITNAGRVAGLAQIPENVKAGIGRNITAIRPKRIKPTFLYYTFQGAEMERQIKLNTDTGSFFKSLNVRGIKELLVLRPPKYLETEFEKFSLLHRRKRELNSLQNQKLTELRDWLLPMLMNGQVTVAAAEEQLGMVAEDGEMYGKDCVQELKMVTPKPFHRSSAVIGTHIIKKLENSPGMGRVKFQKVLHLTEFHCNTELGGLYNQKAAGPHNDILINHIEGKFRNYGHIAISNDIVNGNKHFVYKTTPNTEESEIAYKNLEEDFKAKLDNLIDILQPLTLKETEAISTLFAIWNNRIIAKKEINNSVLIKDFYSWSPRKKKEFMDNDIMKAMDFMKLHRIVPTGWGDYIGKEK